MPSLSANPHLRKRRTAFVVFPGTKLIDVCGPLQVFSDAQTMTGRRAYEIELLSEHGGPVATDTICSISSVTFSDVGAQAWDTVLVSGGNKAHDAAQSEVMLGFLAQVSPRCRRLGSICLGAFVLAAGGHLTGRRATTHWDGCAALARNYPAITVEENAIYVEDRGVWTSAGVTAGIDLALAMVEDDLGAAEALRLAKSLVLPVRRHGGQRQFSSALTAQDAAAATEFSDLNAHILADLAQDLSVAAMAAKVGMSERNFSRRFTAALGTPPARYVEQLRVEQASALLHDSRSSLAAVQRAAGFANAEQMRRAFQRWKGVSPSSYRATFGVRVEVSGEVDGIDRI